MSTLSTWAGEFTVSSNISYGTAAGQSLLLDVAVPKDGSKTPRPAVILVHGGGWVEGDKNAVRWLLEGIAREGYVSFAVNYRLMKDAQNRWPAQLDDVQRAVRWIRAHSAEYGVDPKKIGAYGHSAGGHLVALLATMDTRDNTDQELAAHSSRVQCVVDMSGPAELRRGFPKTLGGRDNGWVQFLIENLMGGTIEQRPEAYREASPISHVDSNSAPFLIFHGRNDTVVPVQQSEWLHEAIQKSGGVSTLIVFDGEGHEFQQQANQDRFVNEFRSFLQKHLRQ
ncbi:MAG: alpha/beta hydrolase [Verrucomicrobiota bacterium]